MTERHDAEDAGEGEENTRELTVADMERLADELGMPLSELLA